MPIGEWTVVDNSHWNHNAVGAIRVSSVKQGTEGDSPEAQREQIERFAAARGLTIKKFFVFLESASKEQQPMQEAVDYCKDPKNEISHFIIKSIDRFTRGGSLSYDLLKTQLESSKVKLVDIYGIIGADKVNTLEHLGVEYDWSVYSPSKKSEILEAERSKDELRDIMTRMIGAQVRYARLGYWVRAAPYGYITQRVDTPHGKRTILVPHPTESKHIVELFKLRASGQYTDEEIADKLNQMGYSGRRSPRAGVSPNKPEGYVEKRVLLNVANVWRIVRHPVYAGVNNEKWINGEPIKFAFDGLVSIDLFNQANRGRRVITELDDGQLRIDNFKEERHTDKGKRSNDYPYKRFVLCPDCQRPLTGSASKGRSGKYYPAYHCYSRHKGHSFRVSKKDMEDTVDQFIGGLKLSPKRVDQVMAALDRSWEKVEAQYNRQVEELDQRAVGLRGEIQANLGKIKILSSASTIKYVEEDIERLEQEAGKIEKKKQALQTKKPVDLKQMRQKLAHLLEHLGEAVKNQSNPAQKARLFGLLFDKLPTYADLKVGTTKGGIFSGVNPIFRPDAVEAFNLAPGTGFEPAT